VRQVVEARRAAGSPLPPPQALEPSAPVEASDFYPWRAPRPGAPLTLAAPLAVNDLLELEPERFVVRCHHALLGRDPSPAELARWRDRVARQVWQRLVAIGALRLSADGRARAVPVRVRWAPLARLALGAARSRLLPRRLRA
jgi:hypothetical protein